MKSKTSNNYQIRCRVLVNVRREGGRYCVKCALCDCESLYMSVTGASISYVTISCV